MYLEKRRLENGRYDYLVKCKACPDTRWTRDIRGERCRPCSVKGRTMNYCHVWPRRCKRCDKAMLLKYKPKENREPTCDYCKGKYGGRQAMPKEKIIKPKVKCSECPEMFVPKSRMIKTCGKFCSRVRKNRMEMLKRAPLKPKAPKKKKREESKFNSDKPINPPEKERVLGIVDKKEKPRYIRERERNTFQFKDHNNGPSEDEISDMLLKDFFDKGGEPSVKFNKTIEDVTDGVTCSIRGDYYG